MIRCSGQELSVANLAIFVRVNTSEDFTHIDLSARSFRLLTFCIILFQFFQSNEAIVVLVNRLELQSQLMMVFFVALVPYQEADNAGLEVSGALELLEVFTDISHGI